MNFTPPPSVQAIIDMMNLKGMTDVEWADRCLKDLINKHESGITEEEKSADRAKKFRQDGNRLYTSSQNIKDYETAYAYYAQSIAHAPANSQEMSLAYSNLSAALLRLEKYSECLQAIDCCLNSGYPEGSKFKIYLRKIECLKIVNEQLEATKAYKEALVWINKNQSEEVQRVELKKKLEDCYNKQVEVKKRLTEEEVNQIWQDFSIKSFNEEIPGASSAIRLKYNKNFGRHFVATRDIQPGEILLRERPFVLVCSKSSRYNCCWECFQCLTNCIPCDCCKNVIFCSNECKEKSWKQYHQVECKVLSSHLQIQIPEPDFTSVILALRVLIQGIKEYGSIERLDRTAMKMIRSSKDPRTAGFTKDQLLNHKHLAFYSLRAEVENVRELSSKSLCTVYLIATKTTLLGKKFDTGSNWMATDKDVNALAIKYVMRYLEIEKIHAFETAQFSSSDYSGKFVSVLGSLFNHSCVANANYNIAKPYAEAFAILPIKKGEQIFLNYLGDTYLSKDERQTIFETKYNFTCKCAACKNDWPNPKLYPTMKESKICDIQCHTDVELMKTKLKELIESMKNLVGNVKKPSKDIYVLQQALLHFFRTLRSTYL